APAAAAATTSLPATPPSRPARARDGIAPTTATVIAVAATAEPSAAQNCAPANRRAGGGKIRREIRVHLDARGPEINLGCGARTSWIAGLSGTDTGPGSGATGGAATSRAFGAIWSVIGSGVRDDAVVSAIASSGSASIGVQHSIPSRHTLTDGV